MKACFKPANILLPREGIDLTRWAVIACDQYTSQPEYWSQVEAMTRDVPSTYHMIYPEVYIGTGKINIGDMQRAMEKYLKEDILEQKVEQGFVLTERIIEGTVRTGLIGVVDLEQYEFAENTPAALRATEGTILSRIPPRVEARKACSLESPHIMLLLEDKEKRLIEPLHEKKDNLRKLYDFDLMLDGGHICGYAVEGEEARKTADIFAHMQKNHKGAVLAVGDGNHSLAAAKAYWQGISHAMTAEERAGHPARYALVEVVNLYSPAIRFEPIHRLVSHGDGDEITGLLVRAFEEIGIPVMDGSGSDLIIISDESERGLSLPGLNIWQHIEVLQGVLDDYIAQNPGTQMDYIHGEDNLRELTAKDKNSVGILTGRVPKEALFPVIQEGKVLPRKAFSMGEAWEKRYYLECRALTL